MGCGVARLCLVLKMYGILLEIFFLRRISMAVDNVVDGVWQVTKYEASGGRGK